MNAHAHCSPYIREAARRAGILDTPEARAARFDAQAQLFDLRIFPDGETNWRFVLIAGPGMNSPSYHIASGFGFKAFEDAKAKGEEAKRRAERGQEYERQAYIKFGRK